MTLLLQWGRGQGCIKIDNYVRVEDLPKNHFRVSGTSWVNIIKYRDLLIVLPMREPSIFRGIAISLLRPVIRSNVEIDIVSLNWVADVRKQICFAGRTN